MTKRMTKSDWEKFARMLGGKVDVIFHHIHECRITWKIGGDIFEDILFPENVARQIMKAIGEK